VTGFFLVLLAVAWAAIFLPAVLRARRESPLPAVERFKYRMQLIAPRSEGGGRWIVTPRSYEGLARASLRRAQRRRRRIFLGLVYTAVGTLLLALIAGGSAWELHVFVLASLALYVVLLREAKARQEERRQKVAGIATRRSPRRSFDRELEATAD
jgi:hypothetical protein